MCGTETLLECSLLADQVVLGRIGNRHVTGVCSESWGAANGRDVVVGSTRVPYSPMPFRKIEKWAFTLAGTHRQ
jgi:hypothetical protein